MKAMLLRFLENHVLFTTFNISLTSCTWPHKYNHMHIMNTHISSAVLYHLEHSTFCFHHCSPSSAFSHVIFEKYDYNQCTRALSLCDPENLHRLHAFSLFHLYFSLRYISQLHTAVFFPTNQQFNSVFSRPSLQGFSWKKNRLTNQTVSLFTYSYFILYYILKKTLIYPMSLSFLLSVKSINLYIVYFVKSPYCCSHYWIAMQSCCFFSCVTIGINSPLLCSVDCTVCK